MTYIETSFTVDSGWVKCMEKNGVMRTATASINIKHIYSYEPWIGDLLHKGRVGTRIRLVNGSVVIDERTYDEFKSLMKGIQVCEENPYGVFCVASHGLLSHIHELDRRWERAMVIYGQFCASDYNVPTKSELDCINEYMEFFYNNK